MPKRSRLSRNGSSMKKKRMTVVQTKSVKDLRVILGEVKDVIDSISPVDVGGLQASKDAVAVPEDISIPMWVEGVFTPEESNKLGSLIGDASVAYYALQDAEFDVDGQDALDNMMGALDVAQTVLEKILKRSGVKMKYTI